MRSVCLATVLAVLVATPITGRAVQTDTIPKLRLSGDLRLRGEVDRDRRSSPGRERARVRFRVAGELLLTSRLALGARLVTAPDPNDPNSTHQDLGRAFRDFAVALDRAYLRWNPYRDSPLELYAGKFAHIFLTPPVFGELVWDADIQPEGVAIVLERLGPLRLAGGAYSLLHQGGGEDVNMGVAQGALRLEPAKDVQVTAALGAYFYGTPGPDAARPLARDNQGNALVLDADGDTVTFASEFQVWTGYAAVVYEGLEVPVAAVAEYVLNASAAAGFDDNGFSLGASVGRLGRAASWRLDYQYQNLGQESIYSAVAQDDFLDATNFRAHMIGVAFQYLPSASIYLWTLWSARNAPREESFQKRFRLDLNFSWRVQ